MHQIQMQNFIVNYVDTTTHSSDAMRIEVLSHSAESAVQQRGDRSKNQTFLDLRRQVQIPERVLLERNSLLQQPVCTYVFAKIHLGEAQMWKKKRFFYLRFRIGRKIALSISCWIVQKLCTKTECK